MNKRFLASCAAAAALLLGSTGAFATGWSFEVLDASGTDVGLLQLADDQLSLTLDGQTVFDLASSDALTYLYYPYGDDLIAAFVVLTATQGGVYGQAETFDGGESFLKVDYGSADEVDYQLREVTTVPEPASLGLLLAGLCAVGAACRRRA